MTLLSDLIKITKTKVNEMDFEFGGVRAQPGPDTTDGPMPSGDDMDDYKDYKSADDAENDDPLAGEDSLEMDIPFLIKILEWAHEEAQSDEEIHSAVETMLSLDKSPLTMDDYESIVGGNGDMGGGEPDAMDAGATTDDMGGSGEVPPRNGDTTQNGSAGGGAGVFRMS